MAAKRKGGLKLNAICAKLSRQVVFDSSSQNAEGDQSVADNSERGSSHYDDSENNVHESLSLSQSLEEDQKRREAIEKWVNGEYGDEPPAHDDEQENELKVSTDEDGPPEGVYMVQPKGCSDNEEEAETVAEPQDSSFHDNKETEDKTSKDDSYMPPSDTQSRQASFSSPGTFQLIQPRMKNIALHWVTWHWHHVPPVPLTFRWTQMTCQRVNTEANKLASYISHSETAHWLYRTVDFQVSCP